MIGALAKKIFGTANDRRLKTYAPKVKAINALGANPQDLLSILQAMKAAGALRADLEII